MPKVRTVRNRARQPPEGWDLIEPTIDELDAKMREAETESHEGKRRTEALWPIFKIHHQRSRYIYDLFYKRKAISRELYDYCIKNRIADASLIAKWKKQGKDLFALQFIFLKLFFFRLRESVLSTLHSSSRHQLWNQLHLPCSSRETRRRPQYCRVHSLRMPRLLWIKRLLQIFIFCAK